ncbi:MAG: DUF3060 domain-containing protein [Acidobacteriota bacterium]
MNIRRTFAMALLLCLAAGASTVFADSADPEIDWIMALSGIQATTVKHAGGRVDVVCTLVGNTSGLIGTIREGLKKRGWTIAEGSDVQAVGASVSKIVAEKAGMHLLVSTQEVGVLQSMQLSLTKSGASGMPATSTTKQAEVAVGESSGASQAIVIDDSHLERTVHCTAGQKVVLNGSHNELTITGKCGAIELYSSHNHIVVKAQTERIRILGSYNTVEWSKSANPTAPQVANLGSDNEVEAIE